MTSTRTTTPGVPSVEQPEVRRVLLCGDSLDCLEGFVITRSDEDESLSLRRVRSMIVGVRVPEIESTRKALKNRLRNAHNLLNKRLPTDPLVRHLIYVVQLENESAARDAAVRSLSSVVCAHHAELEMRHGRDICVTGIVTFTCTDPVIFAERVSDRVRTAPFGGYYATSWDQIVDRSIAAAASEAIC